MFSDNSVCITYTFIDSGHTWASISLLVVKICPVITGSLTFVPYTSALNGDVFSQLWLSQQTKKPESLCVFRKLTTRQDACCNYKNWLAMEHAEGNLSWPYEDRRPAPSRYTVKSFVISYSARETSFYLMFKKNLFHFFVSRYILTYSMERSARWCSG